jgi:transcriptional regulator with XRE-family HTH domain
MNTKSSNSAYGEIETAFKTMLSFDNEQDQLELEAKLIMAKFLEKIQEIATQKGLKKKDLAEKIGTSASYITQLYRGHKLLNLMTLAKLQRALDIEFDVALKGSNQIKNPINEEISGAYLKPRYASDKSGEFTKRPQL